MDVSNLWADAAAGLVAAAASGIVLHRILRKRAALREREVLDAARAEAERIRKEAELAAKAEHLKARERFEEEQRGAKRELEEREGRLRKREEGLDKKLETFTKKEQYLEKVERVVSEKKKKAEEEEAELASLVEEEKRVLQQTAGLPREKAVEMLLSRLEKDLESEAAETIRRASERVEKEAKEKAREILALAVQRTAASHTAATVVTTIDLPSDELKGRIIGREGRNIRAFEKATGCDVIVDDTPGVVLLSSFDGVRRAVARKTLEKLIVDGRIHPARIEEVAEQSRKEVDKLVVEAGKKASFDLGIHGLHAKEIQHLGRLEHVTSEGRNVLAHSVEVAQICGAIAGEFGLNPQLAKRIGLLHDIGRAADHELEGSHSAAGAELARRYEEPKEVVQAIASHHNEEPPATLYAVILQVADAVSHERKGSSQEGIERFIKRQARLEEIAMSFPGVKSAFAMQGGRELRVAVDPGQIADRLTPKLCRDIAKAIQAQLSYPGEIQVTVLRETRVKGFAKKA